MQLLTGTGTATLALAFFTALLATAAFLQMRQSSINENRRFEFELYRLAQAQVPIIVADFMIENRNVMGMVLRNAGTGPALSIRFSGIASAPAAGGQLASGQEFSAAQHSVSALGVGQECLALAIQFLEKVQHLLIRYEDVFGNIYSTEYETFERGRAWYVWRRPHIGAAFSGKPRLCSTDFPSWGFESRIYYDAPSGLW